VMVEQFFGKPAAVVVAGAEDVLKEMAISARDADRFPRQRTIDDLASTDLLIAVKEAEHRPLMRERFAEWEHRLDYWNIDDVEDAEPANALKLLTKEVRTLLSRF